MLQTLDQKDPVVVVAARRTPIGSFQGCLSAVPAPHLASCCIKACLQDMAFKEEAGEASRLFSANFSSANLFSESLVGCVLSAGLGQAPARQATRAAGLPDSVGATTVNKMCGSGLKTVMMACDALQHNPHAAILAGGMESMSGAPYLLSQARGGLRLGHGRLIDHMLCDGLEDAYPQQGEAKKSMGVFAEETAQELQISRKQMDDFAIRSLSEARRANEDGSFEGEIVPVAVSSRKQEEVVRQDEQPFKADLAKIPHMKGAFVKDGSVTAATASSISDGAAMLVLARRSLAEKQGWRVLASIQAASTHAREPQRFTLAPIEALQKLEQACGWTFESVDLFEINEAFAVVTLAAMQALRLPAERVNVNGGACALGHPIGASGARILTTLLHALRSRGLRRGMAAICIGGGEALALAIEVCQS